MIESSQQFITWLREHESELIEKILTYAKENGYTKYTSTLLEAWRVSIVGLTDSLELLMQEYPEAPSMGPDESFGDDPASQFGLLEAQRHRRRGVDYAMFISLFKYYRQTYHDLIEESQQLFTNRSFFDKYVNVFFNRVEIAYSIEWHGSNAEDQIHELSKQNRALVNEKNLYLTIFDSFGTAAILLGTDGTILNYNVSASEILLGYREKSGAYYYKQNKVLKTPIWLMDVMKKNEKKFHYEVLQNGIKRAFDGSFVTMNDISGKFSGYIVSLNDITELISLNSRLELLEAAIENAPITFVITDTNGTIEYANPAFSRTTGYSVAEAIGQNPNILRSGYTSENEYKALWKEITDEHIWRGTFKNIRKDQTSYWESAIIVPVLNKKNVLTNYLAIKQEITEEMHLREELYEKDSRLEQLASI